MNEKGKQWLNRCNNLITTKLEENISDLTVYQDNVSEDEFDELEGEYHYIIYETLGMRKTESGSIVQEVFIRYFSEMKDDLDGIMLDIITILEENKHTFVNSDKFAIQKGEEDNYVDALELTFTRPVKYGC